MARPVDKQEEGDMEMLLALSLLRDKQNEVNAVYVDYVLTYFLFHSWLSLGFLVREKSVVS